MAISLEIIIIIALILLNGMLAMAEIAIVSARQARLQQRAEQGDAGAKTALELARQPTRFLSTVQVGITLVGILTGAFGGATIAEEISTWLEQFPPLAAYAEAIGVAIVVIVIAYLSLILGELAPKQVALQNPERVAARLAPLMRVLAHAAAPLVSLLSLSTQAVLKLLRVRPSSEPAVTEEEVKILLQQGTRAGVFEVVEESMVEQVFRLSDLRANSLITPRTEIAWLDLEGLPEHIRQVLLQSRYTYYPVAQGSLDNLQGYIRSQDLLAQALEGQPLDLLAALQPPLVVPENMPAFTLLERMRQNHASIAFILDEFGGIQGLVTTTDLLEAIVGDLPEADEAHDPDILHRADGSWLLDGMLLVNEFSELLGIKTLPDQWETLFQTLGGFVITMMGCIPQTGASFDFDRYHFEVVDMDGKRVDKVLVSPIQGDQTRDISR
ncbi:MAG: HlyC/CorC family transporter [Anaerolineales bacterium]|nr:HlyC/CorC family transporter [Anaerolineales bacterium]